MGTSESLYFFLKTNLVWYEFTYDMPPPLIHSHTDALPLPLSLSLSLSLSKFLHTTDNQETDFRVHRERTLPILTWFLQYLTRLIFLCSRHQNCLWSISQSGPHRPGDRQRGARISKNMAWSIGFYVSTDRSRRDKFTPLFTWFI